MTIEKEAEPVKDNLGRLLRPGVGIYFVVMAMFCAFTLLAGNYWLAIAESCVTMLVFAVYLFNRKRRDRKIQRYLAQAENTLESIGRGECPFPAVLVRLADGGIVWTNSRFSRLTGIADTMMEHELEEVLPDFSTDWLASGKTESAKDVTIDDRRYRVYGTTIRAEDSRGTILGILYLCDLTELYQVRDEYIHSRPVVAIILIDNYEELTKNLSESAISTLNAKLNDAITKWT